MLVLDVGCGFNFPQKVSKIFPGAQFVGLDVKFIKGITVQGDGEYLPFRDNVFDAVFSSHVLEHMLHDFKALNEISRILKSQGKLSLTVPNYYCHRQIIFRPIANFLLPVLKFVAKTMRKLGGRGKSGGLSFYKMLYHTSPLHYREYKSDEIIHLVLKCGLKVLNVEFYGVLLPLHHFLPKTILDLLDRSKAGKYSINILIEAKVGD